MGTRPDTQTRNGAALLALAVLLLLVALTIAPGSPGATAAKARSCKDVVVRFEPEGSGGATKIKVRHIKCSPARKLLRRCIKGTLKPGWSGTFAHNRFKLRKNRKRISYLPVGGGGCITVDRNDAGAGKPARPASS